MLLLEDAVITCSTKNNNRSPSHPIVNRRNDSFKNVVWNSDTALYNHHPAISMQ